MLTTLQTVVLGGVTLVTTCLLYREIARAVLSSKRFNTEVHNSPLPRNPPPLDSPRVSARGLIAQAKHDGLGHFDQYAKWEREAKAFWARHEGMIVDAEFEDIPSLPVQPKPRPVICQEDGSPLMYTDSFEASLDALRASPHGAWMNRERGEN